MAEAPAVRPIAVWPGGQHSDWASLPREEATRLGFAALAGAFDHARIGDDPNLAQRTAYPFGRIKWDDHSQPMVFNKPGLYSVTAYRTVYEAQRLPPEGGGGRRDEVLWT